MHINKVVKYYFAFVIAISVFATIDSNPAAHEYLSQSYTSVLGVLDKSDDSDGEFMSNSLMPEIQKTGIKISAAEESSYLSNVEKEIFIDLKLSELSEVNSLKIGYSADYPNMIEAAYLGEKQQKVENGYIELNPQEKVDNLKLKLVFAENLPVGASMELKLQSSSDLQTEDGNLLRGVYPQRLAAIRVIAKQ